MYAEHKHPAATAASAGFKTKWPGVKKKWCRPGKICWCTRTALFLLQKQNTNESKHPSMDPMQPNANGMDTAIISLQVSSPREDVSTNSSCTVEAISHNDKEAGSSLLQHKSCIWCFAEKKPNAEERKDAVKIVSNAPMPCSFLRYPTLQFLIQPSIDNPKRVGAAIDDAPTAFSMISVKSFLLRLTIEDGRCGGDATIRVSWGLIKAGTHLVREAGPTKLQWNRRWWTIDGLSIVCRYHLTACFVRSTALFEGSFGKDLGPVLCYLFLYISVN